MPISRHQLPAILQAHRVTVQQVCSEIAFKMHSNAFSALRSQPQPLLDCILYLTLAQHPYDPGTLPSSANQCTLGNVYLRSNLFKGTGPVPQGAQKPC